MLQKFVEYSRVGVLRVAGREDQCNWSFVGQVAQCFERLLRFSC